MDSAILANARHLPSLPEDCFAVDSLPYFRASALRLPSVGDRVTIDGHERTTITEIRPSHNYGMAKPIYIMADGRWLDAAEFSVVTPLFAEGRAE
jgi:hypothetical protein